MNDIRASPSWGTRVFYLGQSFPGGALTLGATLSHFQAGSQKYPTSDVASNAGSDLALGPAQLTSSVIMICFLLARLREDPVSLTTVAWIVSACLTC